MNDFETVTTDYPKELVLDIAQELGGEESAIRALVPHLQHIELLELPYVKMNEEIAMALIGLKNIKHIKFYTVDFGVTYVKPIELLLSSNTMESIEIEYLPEDVVDEIGILCSKNGFVLGGDYPVTIKRI